MIVFKLKTEVASPGGTGRMNVNPAFREVEGALVILPMLHQRKMIAGFCEREEDRAQTTLLVVL